MGGLIRASLEGGGLDHEGHERARKARKVAGRGAMGRWTGEVLGKGRRRPGLSVMRPYRLWARLIAAGTQRASEIRRLTNTV